MEYGTRLSLTMLNNVLAFMVHVRPLIGNSDFGQNGPEFCGKNNFVYLKSYL